MELYGASQSILEVEYFEEVGTGLGPTLEFYSTVSKELSKKKLKLWRETDSNDADEYAFGACGLFPAPMSEDQASNENGKRILHLFRMLGKFVARSMIDSRIIDVSFNPTFFRIGKQDGKSCFSFLSFANWNACLWMDWILDASVSECVTKCLRYSLLDSSTFSKLLHPLLPPPSTDTSSNWQLVFSLLYWYD